MMDAATRLMSLQHEREYLLFRIRDLQDNQGSGLHPTGEQSSLMVFFQKLNAKIRVLVDEVMEEDKLGFVVENGEVEKIFEGRLIDGELAIEDLPSETLISNHKIVLLFLKE